MTFKARVRNAVLRNTPGLQRLILTGVRHGYIRRSVWQRLVPLGTWTLHAPDGTPFRYDSDFDDDTLARYIVWTDMRDWERSTQPILFELARRSGVFVDIGAYSGIYSILACLANPGLRTVAFEPSPAALPKLRSNIALNALQDRVTVVEKALGERCGRAPLVIPADDTSAASLRHRRPGAATVEVEVSTADLELDGMEVGLVKMDAEGAEPEILRGMTRILTRCRPALIVECLDTAGLRSVRSVSEPMGYKYTYYIGPDGPALIDGDFSHPGTSDNNFLLTVEPFG